MRQKHTCLETIVQAIVFLYGIVHVTIRAIVCEMTSVIHPWRAFRMFVVTCGMTVIRHLE